MAMHTLEYRTARGKRWHFGGASGSVETLGTIAAQSLREEARRADVRGCHTKPFTVARIRRDEDGAVALAMHIVIDDVIVTHVGEQWPRTALPSDVILSSEAAAQWNAPPPKPWHGTMSVFGRVSQASADEARAAFQLDGVVAVTVPAMEKDAWLNVAHMPGSRWEILDKSAGRPFLVIALNAEDSPTFRRLLAGGNA